MRRQKKDDLFGTQMVAFAVRKGFQNSRILVRSHIRNFYLLLKKGKDFRKKNKVFINQVSDI